MTVTSIESAFLSDIEFELAKEHLANRNNRDILNAVLFHNSVKAMLADVGRAQKESPSYTLFSIDTCEFASNIRYAKGDFAAFSFRNLLVKGNVSPERLSELEVLDRIITSHIVNRTDEPFLILDSYADEMSELRYREESIDIIERDSLLTEIPLEPFKGFSLENVKNIRNYILRSGDQHTARKEYELFREKFLPHWRRDTLTSYVRRKNTIKNYHDIIENAKYVFIRSQNYGERSISAFIGGFHWDEFSRFLNRDDIQAVHSAISFQISTLCSYVSRYDRVPEFVTLAAKRDGAALADIHLLNSFFEENGIPTRVELISRTPTLHTVMSVLPAGKLKVTLRHPLLIPEIYRFTTAALASIGDVAQRVEGLIEPYLDSSVWQDGKDEESRYSEAAAISQELIPVLRDVIAVQDGLDAGSAAFREVYKKTLSSDSSEKVDLAGEIESLFSLIIDKLSKRDDPFTRTAFRNLIQQCMRTVNTEWSRTFGRDEQIKCRVLKIRDDGLCPEEYFAIRMLDGSFRRIFHIHSKRWQDIISAAVKRKTGSEKYNYPMEIGLDSGDILNGVARAFGVLSPEFVELESKGIDQSVDDERFGIDSALLAAMAFASKRRFSTALSISSTILHEISGLLRRGEAEGLRQKTTGQLLAFREMLLFRHYCERLQAHRTFYDNNKTASFFRGGVERAFAQAQRDIDFAALLSEIIEAQATGTKPAPAGYDRLQDYRLRLAHVSTWIEMFLMSGLESADLKLPYSDRYSKALYGIHDRKTIWSAIGMAKETIYYAFCARNASEQSADASVVRYYNNIEARLIQNYLLLMIIFMSMRGAPGIYALLDPKEKVHRDKVLAFADWKGFWDRYRELKVHNDFELGMYFIFQSVFEMLIEIEKIRELDGNPEEIESKAQMLREACVAELKRLGKASAKDIPSFSEVLSANLQLRIEEFGR